MPEYLSSTIAYITNELRKVIVGQDEPIEQILVALLAEGHALIEGVPGTAKTLTVKTLARIVNAGFGRIQFTPDLMPSDITGTNVFNMGSSSFSLRRGPVFTDILLADEINRTPPKTQAALLEAMEERQVTIDGEMYPLSPMFTVLATENPIEYEGTYPLPEAQLDRFLLKILLPYPSADEEHQVVARWDAGFNARRLDQVDIQPLPDADAISRCRAEVRAMRDRTGRAALHRGHRAPHSRSSGGALWRQPARRGRVVVVRESAFGNSRSRLFDSRRRARHCAAGTASSPDAARRSRTRRRDTGFGDCRYSAERGSATIRISWIERAALPPDVRRAFGFPSRLS